MLDVLAVIAALLAPPAWQELAPAPEARSEVAAANVGGRIAVVGGFALRGTQAHTSARVDLYDPAVDRWTRLPDLPAPVNHAMAAARGRTLYVVGGYTPTAGGEHMTRASRAVFALTLRRDGRAGRAGWRRLPSLPVPRAAGGAAFVGDRLYVMGGVRGQGRLVRAALVFDLSERRWRSQPGPAPREHLGVAAHAGRVYVLAGRTAGFGSNRRTAEAWNTRTGRWERLPDLPTPHGGCSAAAVAGRVVVVGGEATDGTIPEVEAYDPVRRRWSALPPLEQPRHGLGVAAAGETLYALLGGPEPGLFVSRTATALDLGEG
jgi:non-specific serine/threonine protein kinase